MSDTKPMIWYIKNHYVESHPWGCDWGTTLCQCQKWLAEDLEKGILIYVKIQTKIYDVRHGDSDTSMCEVVDHNEELPTRVVLAVKINKHPAMVIDNDLDVYPMDYSSGEAETEMVELGGSLPNWGNRMEGGYGYLPQIEHCEPKSMEEKLAEQAEIGKFLNHSATKVENVVSYLEDVFNQGNPIDPDVRVCLFQMLKKLKPGLDEEPCPPIKKKPKYQYLSPCSNGNCPESWYGHFLRHHLDERQRSMGFEVNQGLFPLEDSPNAHSHSPPEGL